VSKEKDDDKGFTLGGISFGTGDDPPMKPQVGPPGAQVSSDRSAAATAGAPQEALAGLPLRVLVVADLLPSPSHNAGTNAPEDALALTVGDFDGLFKRLKPKLAMEVESVLRDGAKVRVDFEPSSLKSFRPDGLAMEIPLLRSLLDGRKSLERLRDGTISVETVQSELDRLWSGSSLVAKVLGGVEVRKAASPEAKLAAPPQQDDSAMGRILDMVDTGTTADGPSATDAAPTAAPAAPPAAAASSTTKGKFDAFIAAVATSGRQPGARPDEAIALVEKAFSLQLGAILQHPEFRRLERSWRGLQLLASRTPKEGARLEVLSCREDDFPSALERGITRDEHSQPPVSYAVVDTCIGNDAVSLARWRAVADVAEAHTVPVFMNATAPLLGRDDLAAVDRLDHKGGLFEAPAAAPWRSEAHRPASLWVCLALNRTLGRAPYDKRSSRIREATVSEQPSHEDAYVWLEPCWAVATLPLRSFARYGWPHGVTGGRDTGVVEDLPVRELEMRGEKVAVPTEAFFSTETQRALGRLGLLALASQPNSDSAYLMSAATAYVTPPKRTYDSETTEPEVRIPAAPLGDQLFVARLVQYLRYLGRHIAATSAAGEVEKMVQNALWEVFANAAPSGPELDISVDTSGGGLAVQVTVRPRRFLGVAMEEITLGVPLG
jgi:type VI secretion system ImpC/EvpB family protein/type VI secretion system ImpB/VipA family protein